MEVAPIVFAGMAASARDSFVSHDCIPVPGRYVQVAPKFPHRRVTRREEHTGGRRG